MVKECKRVVDILDQRWQTKSKLTKHSDLVQFSSKLLIFRLPIILLKKFHVIKKNYD